MVSVTNMRYDGEDGEDGDGGNRGDGCYDDVSEDHDDDTDDASPRVLLRSTLPQTRMLGLTMIIDPCRACILPPYFPPGA